jgi:hypothetical protein
MILGEALGENLPECFAWFKLENLRKLSFEKISGGCVYSTG